MFRGSGPERTALCSLKRSGNVGTRIFGGRMGTFNNSTVKTHQVTCELAQYFDAVRVIFANGNTGAALDIGVTKVSSPASASDLNNSAGTWATVTFSGSGTATIAAAPGASRRAWLVSDWIELNASARSDSGTWPLLTMRSYVTTAGTITILGNGTDSFTNWASRTDGGLWAMRYQNGDACTTPADFTDTTNRSQSPIVGVQYAARGRVITVMGSGDSITEGRGTYLGEGFGAPACKRLSSLTGIAYEWCNVGQASTGTAVHRDQVLDVIGAGIYPDILVSCVGSPNDPGNGNITAAMISSAKTRLARKLAELRAYQVEPLLWTWMPTNPSVYDFNATDSLRVAYNTESLLLNGKGIPVMDFSTLISGSTDGDGQVGMATSSGDGIHPNDAYNTIFSELMHLYLAKFK